jgi:hypothetical protein
MRGPRGKWAFIVAGSCLSVFLSVFRGAYACSSPAPPVKVGRTFNVEVQDRGKPVAGLQIELSTYGENRSVSVVRTNADGDAHFSNVYTGQYFIGIRHPAFGYSEEIQVLRHPPTGSQDTIRFEWPGWTPLSIQQVSGQLSGRTRTGRSLFDDNFSRPVYGQVGGAKLTLSKAVSNATVRSVITGEAGNFDFGDVPPGLYFLRVETPVTKPVRWLYPEEGYVPLEVGPSAKLKHLILVLDNAICGELAWGNEENVSSDDAQAH